MSPIKLVPDSARNVQQEALELDAFCRTHPELTFAQDVLIQETRRRVRTKQYSTADATEVWRMIYEQAGKLWKKSYGYIPLAKSRHLAATNRAVQERMSAEEWHKSHPSA